MSDSHEDNLYHEHDELVSRKESNGNTTGAEKSDHFENFAPPMNTFTNERFKPNSNQDPTKMTQTPVRRINLILDPSAFTRGIGNIKRWYHKEYIEERGKKIASHTTIVNLHIPSYTLHEFDYLKKGTSMIATYTRQSVNFIDQIFESDKESTEVTPNFTINLNIEGPEERGPPWNQCKTFQIHYPKVKEFPNFKTKFDSSFIGKKYEDYGDLTDQLNVNTNRFDHKSNDIQYENSRPFLEAASNADSLAVMPNRLKYLISSCIFKKFMERNDINNPLEEWKVITEDPITNVWVRSFGIDCMNVNEAELLMFQSFDVNKLYNPHTSFSLDEEVHHNSILQDTIDTSLYAYTKLENTKRNNKDKKWREPRRVRGVTDETKSEVNGEIIKKERFDSINYAPRGKGQLWRPPAKEKTKK